MINMRLTTTAAVLFVVLFVATDLSRETYAERNDARKHGPQRPPRPGQGAGRR